MKRIGNLYNDICSIDNLELADIKARKSKRNRKDVLLHDNEKDLNILKLNEILLNKTFRTSEYKHFKIFEGKERVISSLPYYPDRIVHHAIMNKLEPIFTSVFTTNTYSCIKGRGIHGAANAVKKALKDVSNTKYCLKLDIKQFYPSIDYDILKEIIRRKIKDKDLLWLLDEIIDSSDGIPIGNYLSQYFANLYLTYFDHWLKEVKKITYYFRYADDIVVLHSSKEYLHKLLAEMREYLKINLKLIIKSNYQVFVVSIRGIDFVGYVFFHTHTFLRKTIKKRFARMMYRRRNRQSFSAYNGWVIHCNGKHLMKKILYGQQRFRFN
jgi:retron-type reverse transcriptase